MNNKSGNPFRASVSGQGRRQFITTALQFAGFGALASGRIDINTGWGYTVEEVQRIVLKEIPGTPFSETVDTLKSGSPSQEVSGIVTTMFATIEVIQKTISVGANFIIAHEPTYYNHTDDLQWVKDNRVRDAKQDLLNKHNLAIWRFHDYWHACKPDGISYGVARKAGWLPYYQSGSDILTIPPVSLEKLVAHLKRSLEIKQVRVIGDLSRICRKIALNPGAWGGQNQVALAENEKPDVLIVGETREWETAEYIRDSSQLGFPTALIILGHSQSEEPGMEWLVEWMKPKLPGLSILHIPSGDPFIYL